MSAAGQFETGETCFKPLYQPGFADLIGHFRSYLTAQSQSLKTRLIFANNIATADAMMGLQF